ncbi:MAG: hypothetical protein KAT40_06500 [Bacteroidales bacterium]|nr:hypothetical protein [Bacteroidales bacterium]MCK4631073.1 hypothetical protein [Bacteroidales bacterium]
MSTKGAVSNSLPKIGTGSRKSGQVRVERSGTLGTGMYCETAGTTGFY